MNEFDNYPSDLRSTHGWNLLADKPPQGPKSPKEPKGGSKPAGRDYQGQPGANEGKQHYPNSGKGGRKGGD